MVILKILKNGFYMKDKIIFNDEELQSLARRFKILSEPSRLKILRCLFKGEKCVTDIVDTTGLLQANVSKQLRVLLINKAVECRQEGLQRFYSVSDEKIQKICKLLCDSRKKDDDK